MINGLHVGVCVYVQRCVRVVCVLRESVCKNCVCVCVYVF